MRAHIEDEKSISMDVSSKEVQLVKLASEEAKYDVVTIPIDTSGEVKV